MVCCNEDFFFLYTSCVTITNRLLTSHILHCHYRPLTSACVEWSRDVVIRVSLRTLCLPAFGLLIFASVSPHTHTLPHFVFIPTNCSWHRCLSSQLVVCESKLNVDSEERLLTSLYSCVQCDWKSKEDIIHVQICSVQLNETGENSTANVVLQRM